MSFSRLSLELQDLFAGGVQAPLADQRFTELALKVFDFQYRTNSTYRAFSQRRGVSPDTAETWEQIPPVPTRAFKSVPLVSGDLEAVERVFRTSGTTGGVARRGEHHVLDLDLYRAALLPNFEAALLPDGARLPFLCLLPSPDSAPDSSLTFMLETASDVLGSGPARFFLDLSGDLDLDGLRKALVMAEASGEPVLVAGTAFAFVHLQDRMAEEGWVCRLPEGSRILETGGYKGRSRVLTREDLYAGLSEALGVSVGRVVNEYGMTELLSQFYEPVLGENVATDLNRRFHRPPPWVRTRILDPSTLAPTEPGELGVLAHHDLANLGSVAAVLTEDLGREVAGGFRLAGRSPGAEPRGCSLAMEDFLASAGGRGS